MPGVPPARPPALTRLIGAVSLAGFAVILSSVVALRHTPHPEAWMMMGGLAVAAGWFALKVPGVSASLSISDTFFITSALLFGPAPATVTIALDSLAIAWKRRAQLDRLLFNMTAPPLSLWVAAQVFFSMAGTGPLFDLSAPPGAAIMLPLACLAVVYYALNSGLLVAAVALDKGVPPLELWRRHFAVISLNYFASASAAFVLIVLVQNVSPLAAAALAPVLIIFYLAMRSWLGRLEDADRHVARVNQLYLSTVAALSTAIEAKDGVTSDHIHRVQAYAMGLARALAITDAPTLQAIEAAALLHDTGKIAIPEHILNKPGKLTAAEFDTMKSHVDVGADILAAIDFPYPVVPIVEAHHENWDGSGYPRGLSGDTIPIGARILSVVDCFDALTSDRPYRPALTTQNALEVILERRGTFYDPRVVDTFVRVRDSIAPGAAPQPQLQHVMRRIRRVRAAAPGRAALAGGDHGPDAHAATASVGRMLDRPAAVAQPPANATEELLAFVSLARVVSRTPSVSDVAALAWGFLRQLAPGATLALFATDAARSAVVAEYSAGPAAARVSGLTIDIGQRVTGWVAANMRSMVNSDAQLDLGEVPAGNLHYALAVPLVTRGVVVGVLTMYAEEVFADEHCRQLEMIAPHLATAVACAVAARTGLSPADAAAEVIRATGAADPISRSVTWRST